jgi:hypothetical protein
MADRAVTPVVMEEARPMNGTLTDVLGLSTTPAVVATGAAGARVLAPREGPASPRTAGP